MHSFNDIPDKRPTSEHCSILSAAFTTKPASVRVLNNVRWQNVLRLITGWLTVLHGSLTVDQSTASIVSRMYSTSFISCLLDSVAIISFIETFSRNSSLSLNNLSSSLLILPMIPERLWATERSTAYNFEPLRWHHGSHLNSLSTDCLNFCMINCWRTSDSESGSMDSFAFLLDDSLVFSSSSSTLRLLEEWSERIGEDILCSTFIPSPFSLSTPFPMSITSTAALTSSATLSRFISTNPEIAFDGDKGMRELIALAALLKGDCLRLTSAV